MSTLGFRIEGESPARATSLEPAVPVNRRFILRPTRCLYFHFAIWAIAQHKTPTRETVAALWTRGNRELAQRWIDDLRRARTAPDPDDDPPPCIAEKMTDIAHAIHHAAANPED